MSALTTNMMLLPLNQLWLIEIVSSMFRTWWNHPEGTKMISPTSCITSTHLIPLSPRSSVARSKGRLPRGSLIFSSSPGRRNVHCFLPTMFADQLQSELNVHFIWELLNCQFCLFCLDLLSTSLKQKEEYLTSRSKKDCVFDAVVLKA